MSTEGTFYVFTQDCNNLPTPDKRTGKFAGVAVLLDSTTPKLLRLLPIINGEPMPITIQVFRPTEDGIVNEHAFPYSTDEEKKTITVTADVRISDSDAKLLFLSPLTWTIPFHRSVYDLDVEFDTINKGKFRPKENE